jgi:hypothetical protein
MLSAVTKIFALLFLRLSTVQKRQIRTQVYALMTCHPSQDAPRIKMVVYPVPIRRIGLLLLQQQQRSPSIHWSFHISQKPDSHCIIKRAGDYSKFGLIIHFNTV